jgi:hypothetical protein
MVCQWIGRASVLSFANKLLDDTIFPIHCIPIPVPSTAFCAVLPTLTRGEKGPTAKKPWVKRAQWIKSDEAEVVYTLHQVIAAKGLDSEAGEGGRSGFGVEATRTEKITVCPTCYCSVFFSIFLQKNCINPRPRL